MNKKYLFMNPAQQEIYNIGCRHMRVEGARRLGKTTGILAPNEYRAIRSMPRGIGIFLGNSNAQLKTRTVPAFLSALRDMYGLHEGVHYVWGRPHPSLGFADPIIKPQEYKNVLHFWNGFIYYLVSLEVKGSANGITANRITADEARYLNKAKLDAEVMPTLSGIPGFDQSNPYYKSTLFVSDAALTLKQDWMSKEENKMNDGQNKFIISQIQELSYQVQSMIRQYGKDEGMARARDHIRMLEFLRSKGFFYGRYNTLYNLDIVGEDYIRQMKRDLPPLVFDISILGQTKKKASDGFYSAFNPELHCYTPDASSVIDNHTRKVKTQYRSDSRGNLIRLGRAVEMERPDYEYFSRSTCELDTDIAPGEPLHIGLDFNANINCVVTGQPQEINGKDYLVVLKSLYVKNDRKLRELCSDWCDYYYPHDCREVVFHYDHTAKYGGYADEKATRFFEIVEYELQRRGWMVIRHDIGQAMHHEAKQQLMNDLFCGISRPLLLINEMNNDFLIVAIENAGVVRKRFGWGKDKSDEKKAETDDSQLQTRTDITDAFDTLVIGVKKYEGGGNRIGMIRVRR